MRSRIFMYLFIFAVLYIIFQYANAKNVYESLDGKVITLREEVDRIKAENDSLSNALSRANLFTLTGNAYANEYFEQRGIPSETIEQLIEDAIIDRNSATQDNDLVPYEGMEGKMRINSIQVLNNKWVIANFTDGTYWGDLFITYDIDELGELSLKTENQVLFPKYE